MQKIYGFKESDVSGLAEFIVNNKNLPLSRLFKEYSVLSGKAQGTVRNLYYAIARLSVSDKEFCDKYLGGEELTVSKNQEFSKDNEKWLVEQILECKSKGLSVRSAVYKLANNDAKLALRYQNKFRNLCKNNSELMEKTSANQRSCEKIENSELINQRISKIPQTLIAKLKREIDGLIEQISDKARRENIQLKKRIGFLEAENLKLTNILLLGERDVKVSSYFTKGNKQLFS